MPVPAIITIIIACIVLFILWLLSIRIRFQIKGKDTEFTVALRVLFYRYTFYPEEKSPKRVYTEEKKKLKKQKKKRKQSEAVAEGTAPPKKEKRSILHIVRLITYILKRIYKRFPNYFRLRLKRVIIVVGGADAAHTAMYYGAVRSAVAYLLTACETLFTFQTPRNAVLLIEPNYLTDESMCDIDMDLSISIFSAICLFFRAYPIYKDGEKALKAKKAKKQPVPTSDK